MKNKQSLSVPLIILSGFICFASNAESVSDVKESAKRVANEALGKATAKQDMTHKPDPLGPSIGEAINHKGTNLQKHNINMAICMTQQNKKLMIKIIQKHK